jgi:hypothetical protein
VLLIQLLPQGRAHLTYTVGVYFNLSFAEVVFFNSPIAEVVFFNSRHLQRSYFSNLDIYRSRIFSLFTFAVVVFFGIRLLKNYFNFALYVADSPHNELEFKIMYNDNGPIFSP